MDGDLLYKVRVYFRARHFVAQVTVECLYFDWFPLGNISRGNVRVNAGKLTPRYLVRSAVVKPSYLLVFNSIVLLRVLWMCAEGVGGKFSPSPPRGLKGYICQFPSLWDPLAKGQLVPCP